MGEAANKLLDKIEGADARTKAGKMKYERGVGMSAEFRRIKALPRREMIPESYQDLTPLYGRWDGGIELWPIQNAALWEAEEAGGLFGPIAVGGGKTLVTLLLTHTLESERTVLLVPPQLRDHLLSSSDEDGTLLYYRKHFHIPAGKITIISYSELSSAKQADILDRLKPDLIVADEAHNLRHRTSARTKRFLRYMRENPDTRFVALSGTMTSHSIKDYQHLIELGLHEGSPLPSRWGDLCEWADAVDVNTHNVMPPGQLKKFCEKGEDVRDGFRRRLVETPGVVATSKDSLGASLIVQKRDCPLPSSIEEALDEVYKTWSWEGEEFADAMAVARVAKQIATGFYYKWDWPNGEVDHEWMDARAAWNKEVRQFLKNRSKQGMDSPLLVARAAEAKKWDSQHWEAWKAVKGRKPPPVIPVWLDDFLVDSAIKWGLDRPTDSMGIIWFEHAALGERIAEKGGLPFFGGGKDSKPQASQEPAIVCSIKAHGTGKNLQHYSDNLLTSVPSSGTVWEQLLGRTHRPGQKADEVTLDLYLDSKAGRTAWDSALEASRYIQATQGQRQKLLYATKIGLSI